MRTTLTTFDPMSDLLAADALLERLFNGPRSTAPTSLNVPIGVFEKDGKLIVRVSAPGVRPEDLDISVENNILTIKGEFKHDEDLAEAKIYRREYAHGTFTRSLRLSEKLDLDKIDAEFKNGMVTVTIPSLEIPKPEARKISVRTAETPAIEAGVN